MRRTNKRYKNKNNIKKRKTLKKRFSKKGGVQKECKFCTNSWFHETNTLGAPKESNARDILLEDHMKTHPICPYCNEQVKDNTKLVIHIFENHKEEYDIAESIKFNEDNTPSLINKLREGKISIAEFFDKVKNKKNKLQEKAKKLTANIEPVNTPIKKPDKQQLKSKKIEDEIAKKAEAEAKKLEENAKKEAEQKKIRAEREAQKKAEAEAKNLEQERLAEEANKKRLAEIKAKKASKRAAKEAAIAEKELTAMGAEDILSTEVNQKLIEELNTANTVEDAIEIIESATEPKVETVFKVPTAPIQNINLKNMLSINEKAIIRSDKFKETIIYGEVNYENHELMVSGMFNLFPIINCFSTEVSNNEEYKIINNLILFLVGLFNYKFFKEKIDVKMIIKGGKGAQMILSTYNFFQINKKGLVNCNKNIISDDIDILLVQENGYNRQFLFSIAEQFSKYVYDIVNYNNIENSLISIKPPVPDAYNPNLFKISFINKAITEKPTNPKNPTDLPKIQNKKFNVIADIDFKEKTTNYFDINNLLQIGNVENNLLQYKYFNQNFNLIYWLQTPQSFLAEKQHYLSIYNNIINSPFKVYDKNKNKEIDCDCKNLIKAEQQGIFNPNYSFECTTDCNHAKIMLPKFQKYITPFQQLVNMLNNQKNFAGHY